MNPAPSPLLQPPAQISLLFVEDDFSTRWTAAEYLRAAAFTVVEAVDVNEALAVLLSGTPIDVVFADLNLPGDRGGDFLSAWLEKHRPYTPVLLTSGNTEAAALVTSKLLRRFVIKPYDLAEVAHLLRTLLFDARSLPN